MVKKSCHVATGRPAHRPKGSKDLALRQTAARKMAAMAAAEGITPLDVLLRTMRAAWAEAERVEADGGSSELVGRLRAEASLAAFRAAPYVHPKLVAVAHRKAPAPSRVDVSVLTSDERKMLLVAIRRGLIRPIDSEDAGQVLIEGAALPTEVQRA